MTSLGLQIHLSHTTRTWDELVARARSHPYEGVLLLDSFGWDNAEAKAKAVDRTFQMAAALPAETPVAFRLYVPAGRGDNAQLHISAEEWATKHSEFRNTRIRCVANNEPTHEDFVRTVRWLLDVATLAKAQGLKVALGGFNVGGYNEGHIALMDPLLRWMAVHPGVAWLDCHEYFLRNAYGEVAPAGSAPAQWPTTVNPDALWLLGRYKRIFRYCDEQRIRRPDIQIGEWGPDKIDEQGGGIADCRGLWQGYGYDPDWYHAEMLKWAHREIYTEPEIRFKAFYQVSDPESDNWPAHNAARFSGFMAATREGFTRMTTPTPAYTPYATGQYRLRGSGVRIRQIADTSGAILATLQDGAAVAVLDDTIVSADTFGWQRVKAGAVEGYMALRGAGVTWSLDPAPAETPEVAALRAARARFDRIEAEARAGKAEIDAVLARMGG